MVACAEPQIAEAVAAHGGEALLTDPELPSGTDRIYQALTELDPERRFERVINLQGDLPTLEPAAIRASLEPLERLGSDIGTLAVATEDPAEMADPSVVKAVIAFDQAHPRLGRALYFTRATAPTGAGPVWHHIGIYAYRRAALERFAALPPSPLERRERLEQLRALEAGMSIGVALVDTVPLGVDTPADLARARALLRARDGGPKLTIEPRTMDQAADADATGRASAADSAGRLSGPARGLLAPRLPPGLPALRGAARATLRGRVRRRAPGARRAGDDPDRQLGRRPGRRHPPPDAALRAAHHRRAFPAR